MAFAPRQGDGRLGNNDSSSRVQTPRPFGSSGGLRLDLAHGLRCYGVTGSQYYLPPSVPVWIRCIPQRATFPAQANAHDERFLFSGQEIPSGTI
jgi:hypothetical protein